MYINDIQLYLSNTFNDLFDTLTRKHNKIIKNSYILRI